MHYKNVISFFGGWLCLGLAACSSSGDSTSATEEAFGQCTSSREGEVQIMEESALSYTCQGGAWIPSEQVPVYLDSVAEGRYTCIDISNAANKASFVFSTYYLSHSHSISTQYGSSSVSFTSKTYDYLSDSVFYSEFLKGQDFDVALESYDEVFLLSDVTASSFVYQYYDEDADSLLFLKCVNKDYVASSSSSLNSSSSTTWASPFNSAISYGTLTDARDKQVYKTVKISSLNWMAQNLNYDTTSSFCYGKDSLNCAHYGRLYSWKTAMAGASASSLSPSEVQGLCPSGWHVPSFAEWSTMYSYVTSVSAFGSGLSLRSEKNWEYYSSSYTGLDEFGFSALPGGYIDLSDTSFYSLGEIAYWWSASEYSNNEPYYWNISYNASDMSSSYSSYYTYARSLRCVEDYAWTHPFNSEITYGSMKDTRDSKTYKTVEINGHTWMAENLNYKVSPGSYCYGNDTTYCSRYGRLYTWTAAMDSAKSSNYAPSGVSGVCPSGWHLPSQVEWDSMTVYVDDHVSYSTGNALKAKSGWANYGSSYVGTDAVGFTALPAGYLSSGYFSSLGTNTYWWTSTEYSSSYAYEAYLSYSSSYLYVDNDSKTYAYSVRCMKDYVAAEETLFGKCTVALQDTVKKNATSSVYYVCDSLHWRLATTGEALNYEASQSFGKCTAKLQDTVKKNASSGLYYTCDSLSWRTATSAEQINYTAVQSFGTCTVALKFTVDTITSTGVAYICDSTLLWREATALEEDYFARGTCTTAREGEKYKGSAGTYWCLSEKWSLYLAGTFTDDRDSKVYKTTTIGTQTWLAENLNYNPLQNISLVDSLTKSFCYGNNDDNCSIYGRLYGWNVAMAGATTSSVSPSGVQGVCPVGWHLPSSAEWSTLVDYVDDVNGTHGIGASLKADTNWTVGYGGFDEFGFAALGASYGSSATSATFGTLSDSGYWWTSTSYSTASSYAYYYSMTYSSTGISDDDSYKYRLYSVRCVQNLN